ncbi:MAG: hypothetical protein JW745_01855 [Sedimentisphaerales bacterium]|nr:hypothetical protein [Sedimentisphaerales bacterium]MBN2844239.1 hypothetical protein [Sedimentisphaerales bacterium]
MTITNTEDLEMALLGKYSGEIYITDCGISLYQIACMQNGSQIESVSQTLQQAGQLELIYRRLDPVRHTKAAPHLATAVLIRADQNQLNGLDFPGYQQAVNNLYMALEILCKQAGQAQVWLLIENPAIKFLISPVELRDLIDELNEPWLKIFFNPENVNPALDTDDFRTILGQRIYQKR